MQSSNKSLNLDAYDNTSAYKAHGHKAHKSMYKHVYNLFEMELKPYI